MVGADGSIYVVGSKAERVDKRDVCDTTLYRFNATGAMLWSKDFPTADRWCRAGAAPPEHLALGRDRGHPRARAEVQLYGEDIDLLAFSAQTGALLFEHTVTSIPSETRLVCAFYTCFLGLPLAGNSCEQQLPRLPLRPLPAAAVYARSGEPVVIVVDSYQNIVGLTLSTTDGFQQVFRRHATNDRIQMSTPAAVADGHSLTNAWALGDDDTSGQAFFFYAGPHPSGWTDFTLPKFTRQTPIVTADGRIITLSQEGLVVIRTFPSVQVFQTVTMPFPGGTARAAASHNHLFVSTCRALLTLDASSFLPVAQFAWPQGGSATPAIGPDGRVYALADGKLLVFCPAPPKPCPHCQDHLPGGGGGVLK